MSELIAAGILGLIVGGGYVFAVWLRPKPQVTHEDVEIAMIRTERRMAREMDAAITKSIEGLRR